MNDPRTMSSDGLMQAVLTHADGNELLLRYARELHRRALAAEFRYPQKETTSEPT